MKAISLWQPWASAIAIGVKKIETRGWSTSYRGPLAIHAAKTKDHLAFAQTPLAKAAIIQALKNVGDGRITPPWVWPLGAVVATCTLEDCVSVKWLGDISAEERLWGNYDPGRFGWMLSNVQWIEPIPFRGAQGFFQVPDELLKSTQGFKLLP